MSEWRVEVVRIGKVGKHPNADNLSITYVHGGYPCIIRTGEFEPGDLAVYVPVDSVVPPDDERWAFLGEHRRIRAKKLRGMFSMGLLVKPDVLATEGEDVSGMMHITKYEPADSITMGGENEKDPGFLPVYTDIEALRRWPELLVEGEEVVITEKLHGANGRFLFRDGRLWVGSHTCIKRRDQANMWWRVAAQEKLEERLAQVPNMALYGEVYGQVQDLRYGTARGELRFALFDAMDTVKRTYLDFDAFSALIGLAMITVPVLYRGPWHPDLISHAEGQSTLAPHVREGFVVRPVVERSDERIGRVILKCHGQGYLLRKEKTA